MAKTTLYHGADGDKVHYIVSNGRMMPDSQNEIYFDETNPRNCFVHGADLARRASFVLKVEAELNGLHFYRTPKPGNPTTLVVVTHAPLPVTILEMYVRTGTAAEGFEYERLVGEAAIRSRL